MSQQIDDIEARLRRQTRPALPESLRARVMATAVLPSSTTTWQDRAWFSWSWRLAAAGTLLALLALDHWSGVRGQAALAQPDRARVEEVAYMAGPGFETGRPADALRRLVARASVAPYGAQETREQIEQAARESW